MEPHTKIVIGSSKWLGVVAVACAVASELMILADDLQRNGAAFAQRELVRRIATRQYVLCR